MKQHCQFCLRANTTPQLTARERLFDSPHEGAALTACGPCGQKYVRYFVEHRDDCLVYSCQINEEQWQNLKQMHDPSELGREIRALLRGQEVFFDSPWGRRWALGASVLVEPRPW
jgi:hypothetical protein